jgi:ubiquinone/menaquinone biosynthesis C-methylase UbiE
LAHSEDYRIAEWYNTLSSSYDELYGREQAVKHRAIMEFIRNERFKILADIGCGPGGLLREAARLYDHAVGIDISLNMLKAAKTRNLAKTDLILASSRMLPIKDETVDCVVSTSVLKGDSNLTTFLSEMKRICRPRSVQALSLFLQPDNEIPLLLTGFAESLRVSDRETIYFLKSDHSENEQRTSDLG